MAIVVTIFEALSVLLISLCLDIIQISYSIPQDMVYWDSGKRGK